MRTVYVVNHPMIAEVDDISIHTVMIGDGEPLPRDAYETYDAAVDRRDDFLVGLAEYLTTRAARARLQLSSRYYVRKIDKR